MKAAVNPLKHYFGQLIMSKWLTGIKVGTIRTLNHQATSTYA